MNFNSCLIFVNLLFLSTNAVLNENKFPDDFIFGVGTSAYQIEGAWNTSGKGEHIWDKMTHDSSSAIRDGSNADIACDSYNKYEEDVRIMKELGTQFYRFSISWSRILPNGLSYKVNKVAIHYYNNLINLLLKNNITPMVSLFHCDTPFDLEELGGFSNELMVDWFENYARVAFEYFGDRVKFWLTLSDPYTICYRNCAQINRPIENTSTGIYEYMCTHTVLKAHARVYHLYQNEFKALQKGKLSLVYDADWYEPGTTSKNDIDATQRLIDFQFGIFADPIYSSTGDFPETVKNIVSNRSQAEGFRRSRLLALTENEKQYIKGTFDFIALNHYTTDLVVDREPDPIGKPSVYKDMRVKSYKNSSCASSASPWLKVVPTGIRSVTNYIMKRYGNIDIYIAENGYSDGGELKDVKRIEYYRQYLSNVLDAIHEDKVNIKGFCAWSLLDNFEWAAGYTEKFGLYHVDFSNPDRPRTPKLSVKFYKKLLSERKLDNTTYSMSQSLLLIPVFNIIIGIFFTHIIYKCLIRLH